MEKWHELVPKTSALAIRPRSPTDFVESDLLTKIFWLGILVSGALRAKTTVFGEPS
jgi:hypothetical protein